MAKDQNPDLSIIILNFNVRDLLLKCLKSLFDSKGKADNWQVIVVDNASEDESVEAVKKEYKIIRHPEFISGSKKMLKQVQHDESIVELLQNKSNLGFAAGNNVGVKKAQAPVVLFLNPDTVVLDGAISKSLKFLVSNPDIGALTCKVELPDGRLDYSCHRGFPTPWNAFCYFTGLAKMFPKWSLFSGYTATHLNLREPHEIDCGSGTFLMVRKIAGDQIDWWDKDYFFNGEDIEFCYQLKEKGWKIFFYPEAKIIHHKGSSSGLWSTAGSEVPHQVRLKSASHAASAQRIFYMKHFYPKYPPVLREFILWGINSLEKYRKFKIRTGLRYERS